MDFMILSQIGDSGEGKRWLEMVFAGVGGGGTLGAFLAMRIREWDMSKRKGTKGRGGT